MSGLHCIIQSLRNSNIPKGGGDSCFLVCPVFPLICPHQVKFWEDGWSLQSGCKVLDMRYGVLIWYGSVVKCTVVTTRSPIYRLLWDHLKWRWPATWMAVLFSTVAYALCYLQFFRRVCGGGQWRASNLYVIGYVMLHWLFAAVGSGDVREFS